MGGTSSGATGEGGTAGGYNGTPASCPFMNDAQFCACLGANCGGDTIADSSGQYHTVYCGKCTRPQYCSSYASALGGAIGNCASDNNILDPIQEEKAEIVTSLAENGTPCIQYGYAQDIKDGRGITAGRAGFCTGTGDGITVIECYDITMPGNIMQKYMPSLVTINAAFDATKGLEVFVNGSLGNITGLGDCTGSGAGYAADWKSLGSDPGFKACQDAASDAIYEGASLRHVNSRGFTTALRKWRFGMPR